ncbi:hypothetical protein [Actinomyces trachealis]|uniref:hypothetical protein n=1 Tax=Actinomyces trachealis TaxID=2763540 RepID=UPI0018929910|nr:hypothetical protein [Actinomyces trachealis]
MDTHPAPTPSETWLRLVETLPPEALHPARACAGAAGLFRDGSARRSTRRALP